MKNAARQILWLAGLAAASVLALLAVDHLTREPAVHAQQRAADFTLEELLPGFAEGSPLALDSVAMPQQYWLGLGLTAPTQVQRVRRGSDILAVLVPTISTQGYGGPIQLLVGIDRHGVITGVRVVAEQETPGLGDRIRADRSDWLRSFAGTSRDRPPAAGWQVRKEGGAFDAIAGATISSRAVIRQVRRALDYFHEDRQHLLRATARAVAPETAP